MRKWQIKDGLLSIPDGSPLIMGILNVTPDSFSDGGCFTKPKTAAAQALQLASQGADIIDIGGQSTRPGSVPIPPENEWKRIEPVLKMLYNMENIPPVSVDTFYPSVAERALSLGASIINDVTGFDDAEMRRLAASSGCGCVVMHHDDITSCADPAAEVKSFFERRVEECVQAGISPEQIALDIGIGFGKTREQELRLLHRCGECRVGNLPVLVGASRKRLIAYMMNEPDSLPAQRDEMTHIAHGVAAASGADIIRVHDVAGAVRFFEREREE